MTHKMLVIFLLGSFSIGLANEGEQPIDQKKAFFNCRLKNGDTMPLKDVVKIMRKLGGILEEDHSREDGKWVHPGSRKLYFLTMEKHLFGDEELRIGDELNIGSDASYTNAKLEEDLKKEDIVGKEGNVDAKVKSVLGASIIIIDFLIGPKGVSVGLENPVDLKNTLTKDFWGL